MVQKRQNGEEDIVLTKSLIGFERELGKGEFLGISPKASYFENGIASCYLRGKESTVENSKELKFSSV